MSKKWLLKIKQFLFRRLYYTKEGEPIKCEFCGHVSFEINMRDDINGTVSEYEIVCGNCLMDVGYWAYGYLDPGYSKNIFERTPGKTLYAHSEM